MSNEELHGLAEKITNKIMIFAINNHLLDKDADTIIEMYKNRKGGE